MMVVLPVLITKPAVGAVIETVGEVVSGALGVVAAVTTALAADVAEALPAELVTVTTALRVLPTWAEVRTKVEAVAPVILAQLLPEV